MDIRINDEEYEYLTKPNETFQVMGIYKLFELPICYTFYYCKAKKE
jgi:hypothetical protein